MNEFRDHHDSDNSLGVRTGEHNDMKFITPRILAALLAGSTSITFGQGMDQRGPGGPPPAGGAGGPDGAHRPPPPCIEALDLNHDGIISADEIAKASESLKKLDKNGDGQLTPDELRPPRPPGEGDGNRPQPGMQPSGDRR